MLTDICTAYCACVKPAAAAAAAREEAVTADAADRPCRTEAAAAAAVRMDAVVAAAAVAATETLLGAGAEAPTDATEARHGARTTTAVITAMPAVTMGEAGTVTETGSATGTAIGTETPAATRQQQQQHLPARRHMTHLRVAHLPERAAQFRHDPHLLYLIETKRYSQASLTALVRVAARLRSARTVVEARQWEIHCDGNKEITLANIHPSPSVKLLDRFRKGGRYKG